MEGKQQRILNISARSFAAALVILLVLMILSYALTFVLPAGSFMRAEVDGNEAIVPGTYARTEGGIPFWKWLLSPVLVLAAPGGGTVIAILAFLLVIGGAFNALDACGLMRYMLARIYRAFADRKYRLLLVCTLFFMALGAFVGSYEECVPLVPLAVALAYSMGWDALTGLGMSLLAVGFGFSSGVCNPFTVGVAQELAGLAMFSGIWFRLAGFALIYAFLAGALVLYAKRIEKDPRKSPVYDAETAEKWASLRQDLPREARMDRALKVFVLLLGAGVALILLSSVIPFLQGIIMPVIALMFLAAGTAASLVSGMPARDFFRQFGKGVLNILPAVLLILMASSVRYTMTEAGILDTILDAVVRATESAPRSAVVLLIYALVLVMNLFIASGSAKAFLLIPLIAPLADLSGISRQVSILAFAYGDGFSNVFYPTNPVLLISLGMVGVSYGKWARWSVWLQLGILAMTSALLLAAVSIGY